MPALSMSNRAGPRGGEVPPKEAKKSKRTLVAEKSGETDGATTMLQPVCMICLQGCLGYYGRWGDSGTCSSVCERKAKERAQTEV